MRDTFARCVAFMRAMDAGLAERTVRTPHGMVYSSDRLPRVWDRNLLSVDLGAEATTDELAAEAEAVQGAAGLAHRKVTVDDNLGARVAAGFSALGWTVRQLLVMAFAGQSDSDGTSAAVEVTASRLAPFWADGIQRGIADEETVRQLVEAQLDRQSAVHVRYFAGLAGRELASYCELFSDGAVAQIESVFTLERFRGRGLGKAVVARALAESMLARHDLTFLVAEADDWPKELYRRLGFDEVGRVWDFLRPPTTL